MDNTTKNMGNAWTILLNTMNNSASFSEHLIHLESIAQNTLISAISFHLGNLVWLVLELAFVTG